MTRYHSIETVWKRNPETHHKTLLVGVWANEAFEYLAMNEWEFTEKVDGTNIRIDVKPDGSYVLGGRTDASQLPAPLVATLQAHFNNLTLADRFPYGATIYGEGYGAKIQKGGGNYAPDQRFVAFDILVNGFWLRGQNFYDVASELGLEMVPMIGRGSLWDMVYVTGARFPSRWGNFWAEGIVARPAGVELQTRRGNRVITKIKCEDFRHAVQATQVRTEVQSELSKSGNSQLPKTDNQQHAPDPAGLCAQPAHL